MAKGRKIAKKLAERQKRWDTLPAGDGRGNSKSVNGYFYHKPGSQNLHQSN